MTTIARFSALALVAVWSLTLSGCGESGKDKAVKQGTVAGEQLRARVLNQADR